MTIPDDQDPLFSIVKGSPTEDELAAVMTVLTDPIRAAAPRGDEAHADGMVRVLAISAQPHPTRSQRLANVRTPAVVVPRTKL